MSALIAPYAQRVASSLEALQGAVQAASEQAKQRSGEQLVSARLSTWHGNPVQGLWQPGDAAQGASNSPLCASALQAVCIAQSDALSQLCQIVTCLLNTCRSIAPVQT